MPWWVMDDQLPGKRETIEVSLWVRYRRTELEADDSTLNCDEQCDFTRMGSKKTRISDVPWGDACVEAEGSLATNCMRIWVIRVCVLICWFLALLYVAFSTLNFCGAGLPAAIRIPPFVKIGLGICCLL